MSIEHLPYLSDTDKELYQIYQKNRDVSGLQMLVITFQSKLLNHIIKQLEYQLINDLSSKYLEELMQTYKQMLELI